ncbi:MAG TPA: hypothetical protein VH092_19055 [Urbifossiella sp.]|jgi:hypothetical protein|nr:hypothetical protein [Urbifossiella sp.]
MPAQEFVFAIRTSDPETAARFAREARTQVDRLAATMGVQVIGVDVADIWEPAAVPPVKMVAFGNNRVLDGNVPPNSANEY